MKVKAYDARTLQTYKRQLAVEKLKEKYPGFETRRRPRTPGKKAALLVIESRTGRKQGTI